MKSIVLAALVLAGCNQSSGSTNLRRWGELGPPNQLITSRHLHQSEWHVKSDDRSTTDEEDKQEAPIRSPIPMLTDSIFVSTIKSGNVVVEFQARWCGSCRKFAPQYEALAKRHPNIRFYRLDVDDSPATTERLQVAIVPTMILFHNGMRAGTLVGAYDDVVLDRFVESDML